MGLHAQRRPTQHSALVSLLRVSVCCYCLHMCCPDCLGVRVMSISACACSDTVVVLSVCMAAVYNGLGGHVVLYG